MLYIGIHLRHRHPVGEISQRRLGERENLWQQPLVRLRHTCQPKNVSSLRCGVDEQLTPYATHSFVSVVSIAALLQREACDGFPAFSLLVGVGEGCPGSLEQATLAVMMKSNDAAWRLTFALLAFAALVGPALKTISISAMAVLANSDTKKVSRGRDEYSQTPLASERVHLVLLSSRLTAFESIAGVSGPFVCCQITELNATCISVEHPFSPNLIPEVSGRYPLGTCGKAGGAGEGC